MANRKEVLNWAAVVAEIENKKLLWGHLKRSEKFGVIRYLASQHDNADALRAQLYNLCVSPVIVSGREPGTSTIMNKSNAPIVVGVGSGLGRTEWFY